MIKKQPVHKATPYSWPCNPSYQLTRFLTSTPSDPGPDLEYDRDTWDKPGKM